LTLVFAFNAMDRLALGLLLQPIKHDLNLSDTQLGLLSGIAFALFYSVMSVPLARWADRGNRVLILSLTTGLWCAAVALCGLATSFLQLLLIRVAIGVGEAGCAPVANSLIADHFSRSERPRAVSRYMLGGPLSAVIGYLLAGWLNQYFGWRWTFALLGLPGLALAALAWTTLRDPRCQNDRGSVTPVSGGVQPSFRTVASTLWRNRAFRHLLFCFAVLSFFGLGLAKWQASFFIRSFGIETGALGTWFTVIYGVGGFAGTWIGGELAARYAADDERRQLVSIALIYCGFGLISAAAYLATSAIMAFSLLGIGVFGLSMASGPLFATIQLLVPQAMRAQAIALLYLFANLIGMGLGPLAAGILSDTLQPTFGEESLRYALLILCPGYVWGAWHVWRASRSVSADLHSLEADRQHSVISAGVRVASGSAEA
jgi:predicted MFS family arabinose efflux permease